MRHGAQKFDGMALLLQRIIRRGRALDRDGLGLHLEGLLGLGRLDERAPDEDGSADVQLGNLRKILHIVVINDLKRREKRAVVDHDEARSSSRRARAHPAADLNGLAGIGGGVFEQFSNGNQFHILSSLFKAA